MSPHLISVIGGGGKTTLLFKLAEQAAGEGQSVLLSTTTHLAWPPPDGLAFCEPNEIARRVPVPGEILLCGAPCGGGRMTGLEPESIAALPFDRIFIEADGSARLPVKVHREDEPVLPPGTDRIIQVAGLSALGRPVSETVHRYALAGLSGSERVTPALLARLLERSLLRCPILPLTLFNQADTPTLRRAGEETAVLLREKGYPCTVTSLRKENVPCWY